MPDENNNNQKKDIEIEDQDNQDENQNNVEQNEIVYDEEKRQDNNHKILDKIEKLKKELKQCQTEKMGYLSNWQKSQAELINYRKRQEKRLEEIHQTANAEIIKELLPVLDSLEEAIKHQDLNNQPKKDIQDGLKSLFQQILNIFQKYGLKIVNPVGKEFDPNFCEAVDIANCSKEQDNQVIEVIQSGYLLNGYLLRSAKVRVGQSSKK